LNYKDNSAPTSFSDRQLGLAWIGDDPNNIPARKPRLPRSCARLTHGKRSIHLIALSVSLLKAVNASSRCSSFVSSILLWANAVEALNEHHDGGDAEAGDFGGVVKGAGGEAMGSGAGLGNGFVPQGDEQTGSFGRLAESMIDRARSSHVRQPAATRMLKAFEF
jgi:hypothetical protein